MRVEKHYFLPFVVPGFRGMIFQVFFAVSIVFFRHHAIYKGVMQKTI